MFAPPSPPSDRPLSARLWAGAYCRKCPAADLCGLRETNDACGHPSLYPSDVLHAESFPSDARFDLEFGPVSWPPIPQLGPAIPVLDRFVQGEVVGIRCKKATRRSTWKKNRPTGSVGYAVLIGHDTRIKELWVSAGDLAPKLASWRVPLAFAPGFSTWWHDPPSHSLLAIARSAEIARILARHLPTVPCVMWRSKRDLYRWTRWLADSGCPAFAVDLSTLKTPREWDWGLRGISVLESLLAPTSMRLAANGPSTLDRIKEVRRTWSGPLSFLGQAPWRKAEAGRILHSDLTATAKPEHSRDELLVMNLRTFRHTVAGLADG